MIKRSTTFVVGAGASADYGFPLGADLVQVILHHTGERNGMLHRALNLGWSGLQPSDMQLFHDRLQGSASDSIDTFLEGNEERFIKIGKAAIAFSILEAEARCVKQNRLSTDPPEDHWLQYIWNRMRPGCTADTLALNVIDKEVVH